MATPANKVFPKEGNRIHISSSLRFGINWFYRRESVMWRLALNRVPISTHLVDQSVFHYHSGGVMSVRKL